MYGSVGYCLDQVTDTAASKRFVPADAHPIWRARHAEGLGREKVVRLLDPPVSSKTLERWERRVTPIPNWRVRQLAHIYRVTVTTLRDEAAA